MTVPKLLLRLLAYGGLLAAAFGVTFYNVARGTRSDNFFSETPQNVLLFAIIAVAALMTRHRHGARASGAALVLFFAACAVREFDNELDALLYKGAWKPFAGVFGLGLLAYLAWHWRRLTAELVRYGNTLGFGVFVLGLLQLLVFSRLWGGNDLWRLLMADDFDRALVRVSEEGLELMAYSVIFAGVVELYRESRMRDLGDGVEPTPRPGQRPHRDRSCAA